MKQQVGWQDKTLHPSLLNMHISGCASRLEKSVYWFSRNKEVLILGGVVVVLHVCMFCFNFKYNVAYKSHTCKTTTTTPKINPSLLLLSKYKTIIAAYWKIKDWWCLLEKSEARIHFCTCDYKQCGLDERLEVICFVQHFYGIVVSLYNCIH